MHNGLSKTRYATRGHRAWTSGMMAETIAEAALSASGASILLRRARTSCGEVDLVVQQTSELCFVEVKQRPTWAEAMEALTHRQQHRIIKAAEIILANHPEWDYESISFDLVAVNNTGAARRIKNAFWLD